MVQKEIGLFITPRVENKSKGGNSQALRMQNPEPVEVFNSGSLEGEKPFRRTPLMRKIENQHDGTPIHRILRNLYWDQKKCPSQIGMELDRPKDTIYSWLVRLRIGTRSVRDGILAWKTGRQSRELMVSKARITRTQVKYSEAKKKFGIESDEEFKAYLEEKYRQSKSLVAMAKEFTDRGIDVSCFIVKNWMSYSGIELDIFLRENNRSLIEKAVESGDFANLTQEEKDILTNRGYFEKGQLMPFRKLRDVGTGKITFQEACNIEVRVLRRFEKAVGVGSRMTSGRKDQVGVVKRPVGRPRIEMNREIRDMLLRDRNLSTDAHRRMVGHTDGVVVRWRGELGIGKNPVGRPRKSEPSS